MLRVDLPQDFDGIREQTRLLASALGVPQRGEALLAAMDADLGDLPQPPARASRPGLGAARLTAGPGSLMDAVLRSAGLTNASDGRRVGLEALLRQPPDLLVVPATPEFPSLATALLDHPALAGIPPPRHRTRAHPLCRPVHRPGGGASGAMIRLLALLLAILLVGLPVHRRRHARAAGRG